MPTYKYARKHLDLQFHMAKTQDLSPMKALNCHHYLDNCLDASHEVMRKLNCPLRTRIHKWK